MPSTHDHDELLTPHSPLWAWANQSITDRVHAMLKHLRGVRAGEDTEAVHDMRVWSRRLVAALRVFQVCYPGRKYQGLLREARQVTRALGTVRDLDVLVEHYRALLPTVAEGETVAVEYLIAVLERRRKKAHSPMVEAVDRVPDTRYEHRLQQYVAAATREFRADVDSSGSRNRADEAAPPERGVTGATPFRAAAVSLLEERFHEFYAFEGCVAHPDASEELHEMRIAAKWLRYTMELFEPAYPRGLQEQLSVIKKFQELLGDLHDGDVRLELISETLAEPLDFRGLEAVQSLLPDPVQDGLRALQVREAGMRQDYYRLFRSTWDTEEHRDFRSRCLAAIREIA